MIIISKHRTKEFTKEIYLALIIGNLFAIFIS